MIMFRLQGNNLLGGRGGGSKSTSHFTFFLNKKKKMIPFYYCFKPCGVAILWGQPLRIPSNFIFQKKRKFTIIIVFRS